MRLDGLKKGDWLGITLMALGLGSLTIFLEEGTRKDWFGSDMIVRLAVITAICLPAFVIVSLIRRRTKPLVNLRLFGHRNFLLGCLVNLVTGFGLYGATYLLPLYLVQIQHYNALEIGRTMMWAGLPQLIVMPLVPLFMKWVDKRLLTGLGLVIFAVSSLAIGHLTPETGHDQLVPLQILRALGMPLIIVPLSMITTSGLGGENAVSASGLFNMLRNLGGSIGIALLSALLTRREHFHSHHLGEAISLYNPLTQERLTALAQGLTQQGIDPATAQDRAVALLDLGVRQQAYIAAFNDCFFAMGLLFLVMVPVILLCRKTSGRDTGGAH